MTRRASYFAAAALASAFAVPAAAQSGLSAGVEAATDERRRGLSWSGGDASVSGDAGASLLGIETSVRVAATRGAARHGGADAVADVTLGKAWAVGPFRLRARGLGHLFIDADGGMDYGEIAGDGSYTLGPVELTAGAIWAPEQDAIGGSNLYLYAGANAGIPATPFTLVGAIGRTTGSTDDPIRAGRLRPAGSYSDWQIGVEHVTGPLTLGLDYIGTDIDADRIVSPLGDRRNSGDRILARARLSF